VAAHLGELLAWMVSAVGIGNRVSQRGGWRLCPVVIPGASFHSPKWRLEAGIKTK
jgi:hypothetical protein